MEKIKVYVRVKPSNGKTEKMFDVITDSENCLALLNLKTGENFVYGKKKYIKY